MASHLNWRLQSTAIIHKRLRGKDDSENSEKVWYFSFLLFPPDFFKNINIINLQYKIMRTACVPV